MLELLDILTEDEIELLKDLKDLDSDYRKQIIDSMEYVDRADGIILPVIKKVINMSIEDIERVVPHLPVGSFYRLELKTLINKKKTLTSE